MATLSFDRTTRIMTVDLPDTLITVQEVYDQSRDYEDEPVQMDLGSLVRASGKDAIGAGRFVGITMTIQNGWRLAFAARGGPDTVQCRVSDGNTLTDIVNHTQGAVVGGPFTAFEPLTFSGGATGFYVDDIDSVVFSYVQTQLPIPLTSETVTGDLSGATATLTGEQTPGNPLFPTAFTHPAIFQDTSAALVETAVSGLTTGESDKLTEFWQEKGLDSANPVTIESTSLTFAAIQIDIAPTIGQGVTLTRST